MKDKLLSVLQEKYGKVIYYQSSPSMKNPNEFYFFDVEIFKGPMWLFHLLRKTAISIDKIANFIRLIINKMTEHKEQLEFNYKLKPRRKLKQT